MSDIAFGSVLPIGVFACSLLVLGYTVYDRSEGLPEEQWAVENVQENYSVQHVTLDFNENGIPQRGEGVRPFTISAESDETQEWVETTGYIDFDDEVVIINDDVNGAVVPVKGSDVERLMAD